MPSKFYIEHFTPENLKRVNINISKDLEKIESKHNKYKSSQKNLTYWQKIKKLLKKFF